MPASPSAAPARLADRTLPGATENSTDVLVGANIRSRRGSERLKGSSRMVRIADVAPIPSGRGVRENVPEESLPMTYVIAEPCIGTKDKSCVDVCPVDCIHGEDSDEQLYINPEECIDCGACEPACP